MEKLVYLIYWDDNAADTYLYGSRLVLHEDRTAEFRNDRMPSGVVIRRWYSRADYQAHRLESQLPVLEEGRSYRVRSFLRCSPEDGALLRFQFYDRQNHLISFSVLDGSEGILTCPPETFCYEMQLVQAGAAAVKFHHVEIFPLYEEKEKEKWFGQLWNPDICSNTLNILLPDLTGGMFRLPDEKRIWGISNFTIAPPEYVLPKPFFSEEWRKDNRLRRFESGRLLAYGRLGREAALNLQYTQNADILLLNSCKDLYGLELE